MCVVCCGSVRGWGAEPSIRPQLDEASRLMDGLDYQRALEVLLKADKVANIGRDEWLELLMLQGAVYGVLGKEAKTRDAFRKALVLEPSTPPPSSELPPRVRGPFEEAKSWVVVNKPLRVISSAEEQESGRVIRFVVERDTLGLVHTVRFYLRLESKVRITEANFVGDTAELPVDGEAESWRAEILSERKRVAMVFPGQSLLRRAAIEQVFGEAVPVAVPVVAPPSPAAVAPVPTPVARQASTADGVWVRPLGIGLIGLGAAVAGVGGVFGAESMKARASLSGALQDEQGRVTNLTQRFAAGLAARAQEQATLANVLFGVGGALAAGGLVLCLVGPSASPMVAVAPVPGGAVLTGAF